MEVQDQHDMAAQKVAANDYQPVLGRFEVENKVLSDASTHDYAKADPVFVEETIIYSYYRPIQVDGNCGWRATGFSYFEKLIESGDQAKVEGEVARLLSMSQMLASAGGYSDFEDWVDEMIGLLCEVAQNINNPPLAHMLVQQRWNDPNTAGGIIYYLHLLAATYLKANATMYDASVEGGICSQAYCSQAIELLDREIEHLGIIALVNVLPNPVNFILEIAYLGRSPGTQVNRYRFPDEANGQDLANLGPGPDHYDVLYRTPAVPGPAAPISMQVNHVSGFSHSSDITPSQTDLGQYSTLNFDALAMIPGFNANPAMGGLALLAPPPPTSSALEAFSPVQLSPWMSLFPPALPSSTPLASLPDTSTDTSTMDPSPPMAVVSELGPPTSLMPPPMRTTPSYHIRFSPVQLEYEESKNNFSEPTFQATTNAFKNSVWNRAHYGNPDFHPEEWSPNDEHTDGRVGGKPKPKQSS